MAVTHSTGYERVSEVSSLRSTKAQAIKRVGELIRADLADMTHDEHVLNRAHHMRRRSVQG